MHNETWTPSAAGALLFFFLLFCGCGEPQAPEVLDLDGLPVAPLQVGSGSALVFLFARTDCPISNRYAPEINRLVAAYRDKGVEFSQVYPDPSETAEDIRKHLADYGYQIGAYRDPEHSLVNFTGVSVTPEVVVFDSRTEGSEDLKMVYRGRIDDRYVEFGKARKEPTERNLEEVLEAITSGRPIEMKVTEAVGCYIADLEP